MKSPLPIIALVGALLVAGCDNNALTRRLLKIKPTADLASGTYSLSAVNVDKVEVGLSEKIIAQQPVPTLDLKADGTALIHYFPMLPDAGNFNYRFAGFKSFKANWRIVSVGNISNGQSQTVDIYGISIDPLDDKLQPAILSFTGVSSPDGLAMSLYDGSQDQMLEFSKLETPASSGDGHSR